MVEVLVLFGIVVCVVVLLPLLILKALIGLAVGLVTLPFKILGGLLKAVFGVVGLLFKAVFGVVGVLGGLLCGLLLLVFIPLLPFLFIGAVIWGLARLTRPRPVVSVIR